MTGLDLQPSEPPLPACLASMGYWLARPLPALHDEEGAALPPGLPPVVDAHVHLFPDPLFEAIWRWFDQHGWPIRYKLPSPAVLSFLLSRGVSRVVGLLYAHRAGMARGLNAYMAGLVRAEPRLIGLATVKPGEPEAAAILEEAFAAGLAGVKLHCHVQCFSPDAPELHEVYATCARAGRPVVMHAGREPASPGYRCDPHALCAVERVERVLTDYPRLKLCVPHLGADEFDGYARLLERHDNLWLDTTMAITDYFPAPLPRRAFEVRPERVLYGTDFPQLPYAWDREVKKVCSLGLSDEVEAAVLGQNALALYGGT